MADDSFPADPAERVIHSVWNTPTEEIERKFLVHGSPWTGLAGERLVQGWLRADGGGSVRLRVGDSGATLTIKGPRRGLCRSEWEYAIPAEHARAMLEELGLGPLVEKTRYRLAAGRGRWWEVDVFEGANAGLVVAEIELPHPDTPFIHPPWLGEEVSHDPRYGNTQLALNPWPNWGAPG